ncbi:MAG: hypothetical protein V9F04_15230 [Dermatophilaceae bacterium]
MQTFVTVLVPILTLILGAVASYLVGTRQGDRDLRTRQRIEYLLSAYRTIEGCDQSRGCRMPSDATSSALLPM